MTFASGRFREWLGPALIGLAGLAMFVWSRDTWPDILIDFGRELYVPWQLTEGKVLHRDIATMYGPLSPYINAMWFTLFGVSLATLVMCNVFLLCLFTCLMFRLLREIAGKASAIAGCLAIMVLFAFPQFVGAGNYNFICPYSHEMTHGVMLGTAMIALLGRHMRTGSLPSAAGAGLLLGLVFLTKLEPFIAAAAASAAGLAACCWMGQRGGRIKAVALFGTCVMTAPLAAFALLCTAMPARDALIGTLGSWVHLGNADLRRLPFFQVWGGLADPLASSLSILRWLGLYAVVLGPAVLLGWIVPRCGARTRLIGGTAAALAWAAAIGWSWTSTAWYQAFRPLPIFILCGGAICLWRLARRAPVVTIPSDEAARDIVRLMCMAFAAALLLKMILNARVQHYGFALALPATLLLIAALLDWIPGWLEARGRSGWIVRAACCGVLLVAPLSYLRSMHSWIAGRHDYLGDPGDEILADHGRGPVVAAALDEIRAIAHPGDSLVALPEGIMINYLARRPSSSKYLTFLPPDVLMFGEERLLESLRADPPALILLVHRSTREYGVEYFGKDYAQSIFQWVIANYRPVDLIGSKPFQPNHEFGIIVLRRNDTASSGS